jgi:hypothetical protein
MCDCHVFSRQLPEELQPQPGPLDGCSESSWASSESHWGGGGSGSVSSGGGGGSRGQRGFAAALVLNKADLVEQEAWLERVTRVLTGVAGAVAGLCHTKVSSVPKEHQDC